VSTALLIPLFLLLVLVVLVLVARLSRGTVDDLLGLDPRRRAEQRIAAEAEDMRELLELENRRRRRAGLDEVTEDELRYGAEP
jgi:hypothetical protein